MQPATDSVVNLDHCSPERRTTALDIKRGTLPMENIMRSLTVALGERDLHTRIHSERVVQLSAELGRQIDLSARELEILALGAQFHDLGKIGIPDRILRKPTPFDDAEWECMKQHAVIGERIVLAIGDEKSPKWRASCATIMNISTVRAILMDYGAPRYRCFRGSSC